MVTQNYSYYSSLKPQVHMWSGWAASHKKTVLLVLSGFVVFSATFCSINSVLGTLRS